MGADTKGSRTGAARSVLRVLGLLLLAAAAVVGGDLFGVREHLFGSATAEPRHAASGFVAIDSAKKGRKTVLRSQPWWQRVDDLKGDGERSQPISIDSGAIQWRVTSRCSRGRLTVSEVGKTDPLVDSACPGKVSGSATGNGPKTLRVSGGGPWTVRVEQQIDVPLEQPPLPAMQAAGTDVAATGTFKRVDQAGKGHATFYRLASGNYALRFSDFYVAPNVDLEIRLSPLTAARSTRQFLSAPSELVAPLPITAGSLNFRLPRGLDPGRFRSVVIWCPPARSAYAAATLTPGP